MTIEQTKQAIKQYRIMLSQISKYLNSFQSYYTGQIIPMQQAIEKARYTLRKLLAELGEPILMRQKYDGPHDIEEDTDVAISSLVLTLANQNEIDRLNYVRRLLWNAQRNLRTEIMLPPPMGGLYPNTIAVANLLLEETYSNLVEAESLIYLALQSIKRDNRI